MGQERRRRRLCRRRADADALETPRRRVRRRRDRPCAVERRHSRSRPPRHDEGRCAQTGRGGRREGDAAELDHGRRHDRLCGRRAEHDRRTRHLRELRILDRLPHTRRRRHRRAFDQPDRSGRRRRVGRTDRQPHPRIDPRGRCRQRRRGVEHAPRQGRGRPRDRRGQRPHRNRKRHLGEYLRARRSGLRERSDRVAGRRRCCGVPRLLPVRAARDARLRTLARRAHRMGIPDGTLPRLLVAGDRSLRQHRQGDPLCGAGIEKTRSLSVGRASPHGADLPRRAFRTLHAQQRQTRRKADPAMYRTCTAHGWRWTTASNAPTATRRVT